MRPQNTKHYYRALRIDLFLGVLTPIINFIAERKDHKQSTLKTYFIIMKTIKFLSLLMLVALSAGFASCSDDEDFEAADLVGTWEATHSDGWSKDPENPVDDGEWSGPVEEDEKDQITFKADGTGIGDDGDTFKWQLDGNKLTTIYSDYRDSGKILKLTGNELVVESYFKKDTWEVYSKDTYKRVK